MLSKENVNRFGDPNGTAMPPGQGPVRKPMYLPIGPMASLKRRSQGDRKGGPYILLQQDQAPRLAKYRKTTGCHE